MAYLSAGEIISDAAAELGLGTVTDAFGSIDANIIQLRGLLKGGGRKLIRDRDWSHLRKEFTLVTFPSWKASTSYTANAASWGAPTVYAIGDLVLNGPVAAQNLYRCTTAGTSSTLWNGPASMATSISEPAGTVVWAYQSSIGNGVYSVVTKGAYAYRCAATGISGTVGPRGTSAGLGNDPDGTAAWTWIGNASDYALPGDFSNLVDQTGWNRTNSLPVGGPIDGQMWQYLKGRAQGVIFNVLFRPVAGLMRFYPDTDPTSGYAITFEYTSSWWTGGASSTAPTADAPTANGDLIYFDPVLMTARLKLDWLKAKGFDISAAQDEYDECLEEAKNADGSAPVLNLQGRGPYDPLVGAQNVPWTGFGS